MDSGAGQALTPQFWGQIAATAVAGLAAAIAFYGVWRQTSRARSAIGMDLLFRLVAAWDSQRMRDRRAEIARELSTVQPFSASSPRHAELTRNAMDVLNSFEYVGFLVCTAKVIRVKEARKVLGPFAVAYWLTFQGAIADAVRQQGGATYDQLRTLVREMVKEQAKAKQGRPFGLTNDIPQDVTTIVSLAPGSHQQLRNFRDAEEKLAPKGTRAESAGNLPSD